MAIAVFKFNKEKVPAKTKRIVAASRAVRRATRRQSQAMREHRRSERPSKRHSVGIRD